MGQINKIGCAPCPAGETMDPTEKLFLNTVEDVEKKLVSNTEYDLIRASGLLRQLFLDEHPLVHQVNKKFKLKLQFTTMDFTFKPPTRPLIHWQNLDPSAAPPGAMRITTNLKGFLGAECLTFQSHEYTVREIILAAAHLKGGIHSGKPKEPEQESLLKLDEVLKVHGLDASLASLRGLVAVSLDALKPLVEAVRA